MGSTVAGNGNTTTVGDDSSRSIPRKYFDGEITPQQYNEWLDRRQSSPAELVRALDGQNGLISRLAKWSREQEAEISSKKK